MGKAAWDVVARKPHLEHPGPGGAPSLTLRNTKGGEEEPPGVQRQCIWSWKEAGKLEEFRSENWIPSPFKAPETGVTQKGRAKQQSSTGALLGSPPKPFHIGGLNMSRI